MMQTSRGVVRPVSCGKPQSPVKVPFGPIANCEIIDSVSEGTTAPKFLIHNIQKYKNEFECKLLDNLKLGVNRFTQKITSMSIQHNILLALYMKHINYCEKFVFHREGVHDSDGFVIEEKENELALIVKAGGTLEDFRSFVDLVRDFSQDVDSSSAIEPSASKTPIASKKKSLGSGDTAGEKVPSKFPRLSDVVRDNETKELKDKDGLEQAYAHSHTAISHISLSKISIPTEIEDEIDMERVKFIKSSILKKYDPSLAVLVVCPVDMTIDSNNYDQDYYIVQKVHCLKTFKVLEESNQFRGLFGHHDGKVLCIVLDSNRADLMQYGNVRKHMINSECAKSVPMCQDLIHQFHILKRKCSSDSSIDCLKTIDRMAKLAHISPDDITALKKILKWSSDGRNKFIEVLKEYELYKTVDVKGRSYQKDLVKGKKQRFPNTLLRSLSKVSEIYFLENSCDVLNGKLSLKALADNFKETVEVGKVLKTLVYLSGSAIDILRAEYPGKFEYEKMKSFVGAVWQKDVKNQRGLELEQYFEDVLRSDSNQEISVPVTLVTFMDVREVFYEMEVMKKSDIIIYLMNKFDKDLIADVTVDIIESYEKLHVALLVFPSHADYFCVMSYLCSIESKTSMIKFFKAIPVMFKVSEVQDSDVVENVKFGILYGKIPQLLSSLFVFYDSLTQLKTVVQSISGGKKLKVAVVIDPGFEVGKVHYENMDKIFTYYGNHEDISRLEKLLASDKVHAMADESYMSRNKNSNDLSIYEYTDESSTGTGGNYEDENTPSTSNTPCKTQKMDLSGDSGYNPGTSLNASRSLLDEIIEAVL